MSRAKIDGELILHAINAAEGVLEKGQEALRMMRVKLGLLAEPGGMAS